MVEGEIMPFACSSTRLAISLKVGVAERIFLGGLLGGRVEAADISLPGNC